VSKLKFKNCDQVWFLKSHVGEDPLERTVKMLVESTLRINTKGLTFINKTLRHIGITRMEEGMVSVEKGMRITRHMDMKSYAKFNAFILDLKQHTCQNLISRNSILAKEKSVNYQDLVIDQNLKIKNKTSNVACPSIQIWVFISYRCCLVILVLLNILFTFLYLNMNLSIMLKNLSASKLLL
jgi:hypothetical protein